MIEQAVEIPTADGTSDGYLYQLQDDGCWPAVIHLTDIGGIREANREMSKRLASQGFAVLMPNVFYRSGRPPLFDFPMNFGAAETLKRFSELRAALPPEAMDRDANAYVDFLAQQPAVKEGKLGVVGYCATGGMALRIAAARPDEIRAAASFHAGGLVTDAPGSPHRMLPRVKAQLYFAHAVEDRGMPQEAIEKLETALLAWGGTFESETYQGAHHGWTVTDSPAFNQPQAERAFGKLVGLLKQSLK